MFEEEKRSQLFLTAVFEHNFCLFLFDCAKERADGGIVIIRLMFPPDFVALRVFLHTIYFALSFSLPHTIDDQQPSAVSLTFPSPPRSP
jgi:hypothetical protein